MGFAYRPFASGNDFIDDLAFLEPAPVLVDMRMPDMSGLDVLRAMKDAGAPQVPVLVTGYHDLEPAVEAMKLGAVDVLLKPFEMDALQRSLDLACSRLAPPNIEAADIDTCLTRFANRLSERQLAVLKGMVLGCANKEIARMVGIAPRTVEMHRANLMTKLGARNLAGIMRLVLQTG